MSLYALHIRSTLHYSIPAKTVNFLYRFMHKINIPSQFFPSAFKANPSWQLQLNEPTVFVHSCWQSFTSLSSHSSMSVCWKHTHSQVCLVSHWNLTQSVNVMLHCGSSYIRPYYLHTGWFLPQADNHLHICTHSSQQCCCRFDHTESSPFHTHQYL